MQIGDVGYSVGAAWREPNGPSQRSFPSRHLDANNRRGNYDYNTVVVYWGTVFMRGLDLPIEEEEARRKEIELIRREEVKRKRTAELE